MAIKESEQRVMDRLEETGGKIGDRTADSTPEAGGKTHALDTESTSDKSEDKDVRTRVQEKKENALVQQDEDAKLSPGGKSAVNVTYNITVKDSAQVAVGNKAQVVNYSFKIESVKPEDKDVSTSVQDYTNKLKKSINKHTDFLPSTGKEKKIRIDDIFTDLTLQRSQKRFEEDQAERKNRSEMFICLENEDPQSTATVKTNPKSILLIGKAGIGKTLFCRKLVRDWANDSLFEKEEKSKAPIFGFTLLLTFRQLSLLGEEKLCLRDILNCSSLLDERSVIDEALLQYMIENPEKLLLIIDGYDEYNYRDKITSDFETRYPNDPSKEIPVPAMIAKLLKGKILQDSVVLISSRPGEAEAVKEITFDATFQITGFSSLQAMKYVENYFQENESLKNAVLDHIKANKFFSSFGEIPVMCFIMCYYMEWHVTESRTATALPVTRTDLYHEVIKVFIKKHHGDSKYREMTETEIKETLLKLAELAFNLSRERKYIFEEEDMKKLNLSEREITNLKASGLLDCCPGVKTSPFDEPTLQYVFTHLTIQEYLCAVRCVETKQIPDKKETGGVTLIFMAGLLSRNKDGNFMKKLVKKIKPRDEYDDINKLLVLNVLHEYGDVELSKLIIDNLYHKYCNSYGRIAFGGVTLSYLDCVCISYLLNVIKLTNTHLTSHKHSVNTLDIRYSSLSSSCVQVLCQSLVLHHNITKLWLWSCKLDDKCVNVIANYLLRTKIKHLILRVNNITDVGVKCICDVLIKDKCCVEWLDLMGNDKITVECKEYHRNLVQKQKPRVMMIFGSIGDKIFHGDRKEKEDTKHEMTVLAEALARVERSKEAYRQVLTTRSKQVRPNLDSFNNEKNRAGDGRKKEAPAEVLSPGPEAKETYQQALDSFDNQMDRPGDGRKKEDFVGEGPKFKMCEDGFDISINEFGVHRDISVSGITLDVPPEAVPQKSFITFKVLPNSFSPSPVGENESLVSYIVELSSSNISLRKPIVVTLVHSGAERRLGYETVVKAFNAKQQSWEELKGYESFTLKQDTTDCIQVKISKLTTLAIISRLITDRFEVTPSGCVVMSSVCNDVTLEFPEGAVDKTVNGTMKLLPMTKNIHKDYAVWPCPILFINGFGNVDLQKVITIQMSHPCLTRYTADRVKLLRLKNNQWEEIENQDISLDDSFIRLRVQHFCGLWLMIPVGTAAAAISAYQIYSYLKNSPQKAFIAALKRVEQSALNMMLCCLANHEQRRILDDERFKTLEYSTIDGMRPGDIAHTKIEGSFEKGTPGDLDLEFLKTEPCWKPLYLKRSLNQRDKAERGQKVYLSFFKNGQEELPLCAFIIPIEEETIVSDYNIDQAPQVEECVQPVEVSLTFNLDDKQKRWVVIGISLNKVLLPTLREFVKQKMEDHYDDLKANHNIDKQAFPGQLKKDGIRNLNYGNINNNDAIHKKKTNLYDYKVTSAVDLAKLYLQPHMAKFTDFDETWDLSAVLGILSSASVFSPDVQDLASKVRQEVRNEWGHCNFKTWEEPKFSSCFHLMDSLLQALKLPHGEEKRISDELADWKNKGVQICMGNKVGIELITTIEKEVNQLSRQFNNLASSLDDESKRVISALQTTHEAIEEFNRELRELKQRVDKLEQGRTEDCRRMDDMDKRFEALESQSSK